MLIKSKLRMPDGGKYTGSELHLKQNIPAVSILNLSENELKKKQKKIILCDIAY